jgi:hypothetical protein
MSDAIDSVDATFSMDQAEIERNHKYVKIQSMEADTVAELAKIKWWTYDL